MFLNKLLLNNYKKSLSEVNLYNEFTFTKDFFTLYDFSYTYTNDFNNLIFFANLKINNKLLPNSLFFYLSSSGTIKIEDNKYKNYHNFFAYSLIIKLIEDENFFNNFFKNAKFDLNILKMSDEELSKIIKERTELLNILKNNFSTNIINISNTLEPVISIEYLVENNDFNLQAAFKIAFNKNDDLILNTEQLIKYLNNESIYHNKKYYSLNSNNIRQNIKNLIEFLTFNINKNIKNDSLNNLKINDFFNLLVLLEGLSFKFNNNYYILNKNEEAKIIYNKDQTFSFNPSLKEIKDKNYQIIFGVKNFILYNQTEMRLFHAKNNIINLFNFFYKYGFINFSYVKDIFENKIVPYFSKDLIIKPDENVEANNLKLSLYIDYEAAELIIKTKYFYFNKEVKREDITDSYNLIYLNSYDDCLRSYNLVAEGIIDNQDSISYFLNANLTELKKYADIYLSDNLKHLTVKNKFNLKINFSTSSGLISMNMNLDTFSNDEIKQILSAYSKKKKFTILNNQVIMLNSSEIKEAYEISKEFNLNNNYSKTGLEFFQAIKINQLKSNNLQVNLDTYLQNVINDILNYKNIKIDLNKSLLNVLRPYQIDAIKWLTTLNKYNLNGILADDMGLGKTLETISYISTINKKEPILIICPKSLIYNWQAEIEKWTPDQQIIVIDSNKEGRINIIKNIKQNDKIIYISSYDSLKADLDLYKDYHFSFLVIDEAQFIKNHFTLKTKAVKEIHTSSRLALTGTPIENNLLDLWSIFDFLMPNYLYDISTFTNKYILNKTNDDELIKKVSLFILRRTKNEVLNSLPPKTTNIIKVNMSDKQKDLYKAYYSLAQQSISNPNKLTVLELLLRLRQICVDPSSFLNNYSEISPKLNLVLNYTKQLIETGHKILIFSSFTSVLNHLQLLLNDEKIDNYYLNGQTTSKDRQYYMENFNNTNDVKVMLISLKAGGTGLNLQGADTVFHIDLWWNSAAEEQATDRAYRIGQTKPVNVYKFICYNSIEERILTLQDKKKELFDTFIKSNEDGELKLTNDDIKYLLS